MAATDGRWYPADWPDRIRALARGELEPVTPRVAATVLLLRDGPGGLEVFMLRRRTTMAFAGGAYAYPGGSVDARDGSVLHAAVRETFEEAGVLLAGPADGAAPGSVVADVTGPGWEADRAALAGHRLSFAEFLARRGLAVREELLCPWARWITPEFEARRYDTWFFLAALPAGQRTRNASTEADHAAWVRPADALAACGRGELSMLPPTLATLREVSGYPTAARALAAAAGRRPEPVMATARLDGDRVVLDWPGYDEFGKLKESGRSRPGAPGPGRASREGRAALEDRADRESRADHAAEAGEG
ncbi:NUDIX hydrolase [Streptomyces hoynatensis]|uniref:NUDIX domain-containing protein n=1 Tax=Streptomyces hoynatensis TaxID=1141874 RepID=A0A3A9Z3R3_9ACTN|nr:NUDIX domain-containing protein [Streptomyces hoynatensis]RKN43071.1 NUDIX domain-containing protein [Streptomyces hoynatensis]